MGDDAGAETCDGVGAESLGDGFAPAQRVQHRGVGGEIAGPAHADGGADGDGVSIKEASGLEGRQKAKGGTHGTKGGHRECN